MSEAEQVNTIDQMRAKIANRRRVIRANCHVDMEQDAGLMKIIEAAMRTEDVLRLASCLARMVEAGRVIQAENSKLYGEATCPREYITEPWTREEIEEKRDEIRHGRILKQRPRKPSSSVNAEATEAQARKLRERGL